MAMYCSLHVLVVSLACVISISNLPAAIGAPAAPNSKLSVRRDIRNIIDRSLPREVVPSISRSKRLVQSRRVKRSPTTKELQDPNNCIHKCWDDDDERAERAQNSFEDKAHITDNLSEDEGSQKSLMERVTNNLGSLLSDACRDAKKTKSCFQACPNSQLKDVAIADYTAEDVACEPDKNGGYNNYRQSVFCVNSTNAVSREYCAQQCQGEVKSLRDVTELAIDKNESDSSSVNVESDANQNAKKVKDQCKIITCTRDCSKRYLVKRCGQKGFDLYSRQLSIEPRSTLTILQKISAIKDVPSECNSLK